MMEWLVGPKNYENSISKNWRRHEKNEKIIRRCMNEWIVNENRKKNNRNHNNNNKKEITIS